MIDWPCGPDLNDYGALLGELCKFTERKVLVEIGVACGLTTRHLCAAAHKTGGHVYGYDVWEPHGLKHQFLQFCDKAYVETSLRSLGFDNFTMTQVRTESPEFHGLLRDQTGSAIDFAFIDGCHSYEGIKRDYNHVLPLLTDDAIVVFHDTRSIDGCREFMLDLRSELNDGTFDMIELPFGYFGRKVGVNIMVRRTFAPRKLPIDEICNREDNSRDILNREKWWYLEETKRV